MTVLMKVLTRECLSCFGLLIFLVTWKVERGREGWSALRRGLRV